VGFKKYVEIVLGTRGRTSSGCPWLRVSHEPAGQVTLRAGVILPIVYESARLVVELVAMESADGAVLRREETERVRMPCRE